MTADSSQQMTLLVPGLCPGGADAGLLDRLTERPPALERLLSRSRLARHDVSGLDASLCAHFELQNPAGAAVPVAALTCLIDIETPDAGYILRADPVHLRADSGILRLFDSRTFSITQAEADELVAAFNEFYKDRGWRLVAPCPQRWYLYLPDAPLIRTVSPAMIAGQSIDAHLPQGRDAAFWHALMNEVQMLFHRHPLNERREANGEPMINSLWFWGEGRLPEVVCPTGLQVATDNPLAMGLAHFSQTPRSDLPENLDALLETAEQTATLVVLEDLEAALQYTDVAAWLNTLAQLERHWFAPLLGALADGRVASVELDPCNGTRFHTTHKLQRKFWKRVRPLAALCRHG